MERRYHIGVSLQAPSSSAPGAATHPTTVLVVDDQPDVREIIVRLLEEGGYATLAADGADEAVRYLSGGNSVDVVLTDVTMPDQTGVELAYRIQRDFPSVAVAILSGDVSEIERSVIARAGVPFLKKPIMADALYSAIREAIRQRNQR